MKLIFRLSSTYPKFGDPKDIYYKKDLLFLLRTKKNKLIGGYVHTVIDPKKS